MRKYYSQHGEDVLLDLIFQDQKTGFFVEVGCIDGRRFSNTLTFEERGWIGLCVEAHAGYIDMLKRNRPNSIVCHCAAGESDEDAIFYANARGSLSTLDSSKEESFRENYKLFFSGFKEQKVKKHRLSTLLDEYHVGEIDVLSLDIEGYEVEALKGLDLTRHRPKVLVIESDSKAHEEQIDSLVVPHGYIKSIRLFANIFYVLDQKMDLILKNKKIKTSLIHTQHPMDKDGDQKITVTIDTTAETASNDFVTAAVNANSPIKTALRPMVRWLRARICPPQSQEKRTHGRMAVRDRYADIKAKLGTESPIIVDGGANTGTTIEALLEVYQSPIIHAFEPIPELVYALNRKFSESDNVFIHGVALGAEENSVGFNVVNNLVSSSVLNPSSINKRLHGERMDIRQRVEVKQVRLDDELKDVTEIDLLKLDLQGYELEALKGCGSLLERVKIIATEIEFVSLYDGQPLFGDIDVYLRAHDFRVFNLYELYTHPDGQLTAGDAVYLNNRYF